MWLLIAGYVRQADDFPVKRKALTSAGCVHDTKRGTDTSRVYAGDTSRAPGKTPLRAAG